MKSRLLKIKFHKSKLQVLVEVSNVPGENAGGIYLQYRSKLAEKQCRFPFSVVKQQSDGQLQKIRAKIDLEQLPLQPIYWDLVLETKQKDRVDYEPIAIGKAKNKIRFPLYDGKYYNRKNGWFFHPYITPEKTVGFQFRERTAHDTRGFRIQEGFVLLLYYITKPYWKRQNIYLVYEKFCAMAQDNAYYFFKYCMEHNVEAMLGGHMYYIIDKKSADLEKVQPYSGHIIYFMSLKHKLYLLAAKLLISTDTKKHVYAWRYRMSLLDRYIRRKRLVFLQHGVTALKRVDYIYGKGNFGTCDLFVVTSDYERNIVEQNFGYKGDEIAVTGFARWDVLEDKSKGSRLILVMPTWRNWLEEVDDAAFMESDYYRHYMALLTSPALHRMLEELDLQMCFYIHPKFREYMKDFVISADRIRMVPFGQEPLNELMMQCRLLVTDYSSVCWDVYYQGKPVVFYQFDLAQYLEAHGSYMDMDKELFGERETEADKLISRIREYAQQDFKLKAQAAEQIDYYFKYRDNENSKRIAEHILTYFK